RVSAVIPPGVRKGDMVDVEVTVPPMSKVSSLRGGYLVDTLLYNYEFARNLSAAHANSDKAFIGHPVARAEGALLVGFGEGDGGGGAGRGRGGGGRRGGRGFFPGAKEGSAEGRDRRRRRRPNQPVVPQQLPGPGVERDRHGEEKTDDRPDPPAPVPPQPAAV